MCYEGTKVSHRTNRKGQQRTPEWWEPGREWPWSGLCRLAHHLESTQPELLVSISNSWKSTPEEIGPVVHWGQSGNPTFLRKEPLVGLRNLLDLAE